MRSNRRGSGRDSFRPSVPYRGSFRGAARSRDGRGSRFRGYHNPEAAKQAQRQFAPLRRPNVSSSPPAKVAKGSDGQAVHIQRESKFNKGESSRNADRKPIVFDIPSETPGSAKRSRERIQMSPRSSPEKVALVRRNSMEKVGVEKEVISERNEAKTGLSLNTEKVLLDEVVKTVSPVEKTLPSATTSVASSSPTSIKPAIKISRSSLIRSPTAERSPTPVNVRNNFKNQRVKTIAEAFSERKSIRDEKEKKLESLESKIESMRLSLKSISDCAFQSPYYEKFDSDIERYKERMESFQDLSNWKHETLALSPIELARHGWRLIEAETLQCDDDACRTVVKFSPENRKDSLSSEEFFALQEFQVQLLYKSKHKSVCRFSTMPVAYSSINPFISDVCATSSALEYIKPRINQWYDQADEDIVVPTLPKLLLNEMKEEEIFNKMLSLGCISLDLGISELNEFEKWKVYCSTLLTILGFTCSASERENWLYIECVHCCERSYCHKWRTVDRILLNLIPGERKLGKIVNSTEVNKQLMLFKRKTILNMIERDDDSFRCNHRFFCPFEIDETENATYARSLKAKSEMLKQSRKLDSEDDYFRVLQRLVKGKPVPLELKREVYLRRAERLYKSTLKILKGPEQQECDAPIYLPTPDTTVSLQDRDMIENVEQFSDEEKTQLLRDYSRRRVKEINLMYATLPGYYLLFYYLAGSSRDDARDERLQIAVDSMAKFNESAERASASKEIGLSCTPIRQAKRPADTDSGGSCSSSRCSTDVGDGSVSNKKSRLMET